MNCANVCVTCDGEIFTEVMHYVLRNTVTSKKKYSSSKLILILSDSINHAGNNVHKCSCNIILISNYFNTFILYNEGTQLSYI